MFCSKENSAPLKKIVGEISIKNNNNLWVAGGGGRGRAHMITACADPGFPYPCFSLFDLRSLFPLLRPAGFDNKSAGDARNNTVPSYTTGSDPDPGQVRIRVSSREQMDGVFLLFLTKPHRRQNTNSSLNSSFHFFNRFPGRVDWTVDPGSVPHVTFSTPAYRYVYWKFLQRFEPIPIKM